MYVQEPDVEHVIRPRVCTMKALKHRISQLSWYDHSVVQFQTLVAHAESVMDVKDVLAAWSFYGFPVPQSASSILKLLSMGYISMFSRFCFHFLCLRFYLFACRLRLCAIVLVPPSVWLKLVWFLFVLSLPVLVVQIEYSLFLFSSARSCGSPEPVVRFREYRLVWSFI